MIRVTLIWLIWPLWLIPTACGTSPPAPDAPPPLCTNTMPAAPTFTNVQRMITLDGCTQCHTTGAALILDPAVAYANLVGKMAPNYLDPATDESCGGLLVKPGDPAASYLYQKLSTDAPCAGARMPRDEFGGSVVLPACHQQLVHDWIAAGAAND